jgi:hypothetical protein
MIFHKPLIFKEVMDSAGQCKIPSELGFWPWGARGRKFESSRPDQ